MKKRILGIALVLAMMVSLCGCKMVMGFQVNDDNSVDCTVEMLIEAEVIDSLYAETDSDPKELLEEGYRLVTVDGIKYYQYAATDRITDLIDEDEMNLSEMISQNCFVLGANEAVDQLESMSDESIPEEDFTEEDELWLESMEDYMSYEVYVTLPSKITKTNGELSKDKKTATWSMSANAEFEANMLYAFTDEYKDDEKPVIKGAKNNATYQKSVKVKYSDNCGVIKSATLDGKKFTSGKKVSKEGTHTVVVEDLFGNKRTVIFTIKK